METEAPSLQDLPHSIVALLLDHLLTGGGSGGLKAAVRLAHASRALAAAVDAAETFWQAQCRRLGWSLEWLALMPPRTSSWRYFQARMAARYRLRRQLRQLQLFLDPLSAAALRPGNSPEAIAEVEAALQLPLPTELYELYRFCDGQDQERGGVRCIDDARLLSLHEMRAAVQERHGPLEGPRELARLKRQRAQPAPQADGSSSGGGGTARHGEAGPSSTSDELPPPAPDFLLPFTAELRGRRRFALCLEGRCWLVSGFNTIAFAPSLADLIRRTLT